MNIATRVLLVSLAVPWAMACTPFAPQTALPAPSSDPRVTVGEPRVTARAGQPGAPVDCAVDVTNRSGQAVPRLLVRCELLDERGVPVGTGVGTIGSLPSGESRSVRTVVFGVRTFATARAVVTPASSQ